MKKMTLCLAALLLASPLAAQLERLRHVARTILVDDDDGRVEAWRRGDSSIADAGASTIRQPVFEVIFAGAGWDQHSRESLTRHLTGVPMPAGVQPASIAGSREYALADRVNDLQLQILIDRGMRDGSLPLRDANVVYIIFLSSTVRSSLGPSRAVQDYDSYYSHFNVHDTNVRYVVVPWNDDESVLREAAANSTLRAVVNPDGN